MPVPDRLRRPALAAGLLILSACGRGDDPARLDRLSDRVTALERRVDALTPAPAASRAAPGQVAPSIPAASSATYAAGAIAVVHPAPTNARVLAEVPADSVGGFVYTGGPLALHDLSSRGVRYAELAGVELQGWFKAAQAGRYQFGEDLHGTLGPGAIVGADCALQVWLEDRVIGTQQSTLPPSASGEAKTSLVVGADLQPGLYKLRLWTACAPTLPRQAHITADLLVKPPDDLNLRGFKPDELLHQP